LLGEGRRVFLIFFILMNSKSIKMPLDPKKKKKRRRRRRRERERERET
jgi:hypothetical protein